MRLNIAALLCSTMSLVTGIAHANSTAIEEVIVTAQKRTETQQDVAASFNVYSESSIENAGWGDVEDVAQQIPSLELIGNSKTRTSVYIRSIGTNKYDIGTEGSIGVFVDGIYIPRFSSLMQNLLDLERVEVLRGPQGTLYGRNTIGGAISLYTKPAEYQWTRTLEGGVGEDNSHHASFKISGPINDELLAYVGITTREDAGHREELLTGKTNSEELTAGRLKLTWMPSDQWETQFTADYSSQKENAVLSEYISSIGNVFALSPLIPEAVAQQVLEQEAEDDLTGRLNDPGGTDLAALASNVLVRWTNDDLIFESITGFRDEELTEDVDNDSLPFDILSQSSDQRSETISQEFKLTSEEGGAYSMDYKAEWLVGVFLYQDKAEREDVAPLGVDSAANVLSLPPLNIDGPYPLGFDVDLETRSWAAFAEMGYYLTDEWSVTVGVRYSKDKKDFTYTAFTDPNQAFIFPLDNFQFDDSLEFESTDPKLVVQWEPEAYPDFNAYLSYTQGYKSGGIQFIARRQEVAEQSFDKEVLRATEMGFKSRWLNHSLQVNGSIYHYDYQDQQIDGFVLLGDASMNITENAGASTIKGAELDVIYKPLPDLMLQMSYAYMDAYFDEFNQPGGGDLSGNRLPSSPKHAAWVSAEYNHWFASNWELSTRMDYSWRDDQVFAASGFFEQPAYGLLNLGVWLTNPEDTLTARVFCGNCSNKTYATNIYQLTPTDGWRSTGSRRTYGISVTYDF